MWGEPSVQVVRHGPAPVGRGRSLVDALTLRSMVRSVPVGACGPPVRAHRTRRGKHRTFCTWDRSRHVEGRDLPMKAIELSFASSGASNQGRHPLLSESALRSASSSLSIGRSGAFDRGRRSWVWKVGTFGPAGREFITEGPELVETGSTSARGRSWSSRTHGRAPAVEVRTPRTRAPGFPLGVRRSTRCFRPSGSSPRCPSARARSSRRTRAWYRYQGDEFLVVGGKHPTLSVTVTAPARRPFAGSGPVPARCSLVARAGKVGERRKMTPEGFEPLLPA